ncbi:MAG: GNAT family N-acetyltransferase [Finegoldia sp.]|nr:GNAT family N-acetyltransferase [Finegoldia sp.]
MIKVVYEGEKFRAAAYDDEKIVGECTYIEDQGLWTIDHTQVMDDYKDQGIEERLVEELVKQAREKGVKITPMCSIAKGEFDKHEEYRDVLKK